MVLIPVAAYCNCWRIILQIALKELSLGINSPIGVLLLEEYHKDLYCVPYCLTSISKRIYEKVPNENCRVLSKISPKRNKINSHGPPTAPKQPESPNWWDGREEERRRGEKSKICSPSLHISYFGREKKLPETKLFVAGTFLRIRTDFH